MEFLVIFDGCFGRDGVPVLARDATEAAVLIAEHFKKTKFRSCAIFEAPGFCLSDQSRYVKTIKFKK